ncbi:MAG: hypothetical protein Q8Q09_19360 [Deltaproteobacteria bacterium]|nr:hypothetical protein [Deltaproteobacteria bacterium]
MSAGVGEVWATGRCARCGVEGRASLGLDAITVFSQADARAARTRAVLMGLRDAGCVHAVYDRGWLADMALRPTLGGLATALSVLCEESVTRVREVLAAGPVRWDWRDDSLEIVSSVGTIGASLGADEAWEILGGRGCVPVGWVGDGRWGSAGAPEDLRACVTLAADVPGVVLAESLARECLARARPWMAQEVTQWRWSVVDASRWVCKRPVGLSEALQGMVARTAAVHSVPLAEAAQSVESVESGHAWWVQAAAESSLAGAWAALSACGATVVLGARAGERVQGFAALRDPMEPLLALWGTGYALGGIDGHCATLVAPRIGG